MYQIKCPCCGELLNIDLTSAAEDITQTVKQMYKVIAIIGPSGSGKTTLLNELAKYNDFHIIKQFTTRPKRDTETGTEYNFIDVKTFQNYKPNNLVEFVQFRDWFYGTHINQLKFNAWNIGIFSPEAVKQLLQRPDMNVKVYYLYVDEKTCIKRAAAREDNPNIAEISRRILADRTDFSPENLSFDYSRFPFYNREDIDYALTVIKGYTDIID